MGMGWCSKETKSDFNSSEMLDPLSVYIPLVSLTKATVRSVVSAVGGHDEPDWDHSRRTLLAFLLALNKTVKEIEQSKDNDNQVDEHTVQHAKEVRQWLVKENTYGKNIQLDWNELETRYQRMINGYFEANAKKPYSELTKNAVSYFVD
jgi:hypothetical protein